MIYLKKGEKIEGKIIERKEDLVTVKLKGGGTVPYWLDEIDRIDEAPPAAPATQDEVPAPGGTSELPGSPAPTQAVVAARAGTGETVEIEHGITFKNPEGWILTTGEQAKRLGAMLAGLGASAGALGSMPYTNMQQPEILAIIAKYPVGTKGNFIIWFSATDLSSAFSAVDFSHARMPTPTELLDVVASVGQEQIQKSPWIALIADSPIKEIRNGREWRVLEYKIAPGGAHVHVVHTYLTMLGERSALSISAQAKPEMFELHKKTLEAVIASLEFHSRDR